MIFLFLSLAVTVFLHLIAMAITANLLGVKVIEFSYGIGPKIFGLKNNVIKLIPIAGYVKMLDSKLQNLEAHELQFAFDRKSRLVRSFIPLSGCFILIFISFVLIGPDSFYSLVDGFRQIAMLVLSPTEGAQVIIESASAFISSNSFLVIFALTATKFSALNLLPIPLLNGGQAILELFYVSEKTKLFLVNVGMLVFLAMLISFIIALVNFG